MEFSILPIIRKEFLRIIRDRRALAITLVAPLVQLIKLGYAATSDVRNVPIAICDQDRTRRSRQIVDTFITSDQLALARRWV